MSDLRGKLRRRTPSGDSAAAQSEPAETPEATEPEPRSGQAQAGAPQGVGADAPATPVSGTAETAAGRPAAAATAQRRNAPQAIAAARTAASGAGNGPDEDSPDGRSGPNKPILAGAAIVGAILVTLPLLLVGANKHEDKKAQVEPVAVGNQADTVLDGDDPQGSGDFVVESPTPSPSPTVSKSPKAPKSASPSPSPSAEKPKEHKAPAAVAAQSAVAVKPPQNSAAGAVLRLAGNDLSARHICYRAYVSGQGWQKPVCDGAMAGTTNQNRPIKALNIAVSGSGGSSANAFVHNPASKNGKGKWMPEWTTLKADGANNYIGSTDKSAPVMSGFAINIGKGRICQTAKVHAVDWFGKGCADARPRLTFGGSLRNDRYLEAVKLTV
ncbi:hydrogenase expression protein HypA [Streptomyces sp. NPDC007084]|uniref:hydrogenase expression protein HypA n=1 Tax=Streptomyces sp. NPDC007084 TaxID=3154313 RepID=UPI0034550F9F